MFLVFVIAMVYIYGKQVIHIQSGWVIPDIGICSMRVYLSLPPPTV